MMSRNKSKNKDNLTYIGKNLFKAFSVTNPILNTRSDQNSATYQYSQEITTPKYDSDRMNIIHTIKFLNNLIPYQMPLYNFDVHSIEGDYYYKPSGDPLLIREFDSDIIRDYYIDKDEVSIFQILEHDTITGKLKAKIDPVKRKTSTINTNIVIFDEIINNKYILMQLTETGIVSNITEFSGQGKSFKTLFRDIKTLKPVRYMEGKDDKQNSFEMIDCILDKDENIARMRRYNKNKEIDINYQNNKKIITVNNKN